MKTLLLIFSIFAFCDIISAQPIYYPPPRGEKELIKIQDIKTEKNISELGVPCGDYFLFDATRDTVTFKAQIKSDEHWGIDGLLTTRTDRIILSFDPARKTPTVEALTVNKPRDKFDLRMVYLILRMPSFVGPPPESNCMYNISEF